MNPRFEHQSLRVHQDVTLTSFDLFGPVVTALSLPPTPVVLTDWLSTMAALG
jgi:hypothetical protein